MSPEPCSTGFQPVPDGVIDTARHGLKTRATKGRPRRFLVIIFAFLLPYLIFKAAVLWLPEAQPGHAAPESTLLLDRDGQPLFASVAFDGQWRIPLDADAINPDLINAIIAVEDSRFYKHAGVDWRSVAGAAMDDLKHLSIRRGASTITMQLSRLRDPQPRTFLAKLDQAVRAVQIERRMDKRAIVIEYLNRAPFGANIVGASAASWRYFDKPCRSLSLAQCAMLAGLPQAPNRLRPDRIPDLARARRDHVLDRMLAARMISQVRHDQALAEPLDASSIRLPQNSRDDGLLPTSLSIAQEYRGRTVRTTIDSSMQAQAARIARDRLAQLAPSGVSAAAVVVLDTQTADLLAAVSISDDAPRVDLTRAARSTGSTLKPLIYAAAFDAGVCTQETELSDAPAAWAGYAPANYDRAFRGTLTAADALAESRNLPAMTVLSRVGVRRAVDVMGAMGLTTLARTPGRFGLPLAIGGAEATPMEIAEAYATLARGGSYKPTSFISAACGLADRSIQCAKLQAVENVLLASSCLAALNAIASPDRTSNLCPEALRSNVAWKTGTSSGHRDAWCAAVTHRRTVVVWFGTASGKGSAALVGADAAAPAALTLIAALDPVDDPWPASDSKRNARMQAAGAGVTIVSPVNGSELIVSDETTRHAIELRAGSGGSSESLWWFVDGTPIGTGASIEWMPLAGAHEIRALDDAGHSALARVRVR